MRRTHPSKYVVLVNFLAVAFSLLGAVRLEAVAGIVWAILLLVVAVAASVVVNVIFYTKLDSAVGLKQYIFYTVLTWVGLIVVVPVAVYKGLA